MRTKSESSIDVKFVTAKTRITPVSGMSIPRLELLSALLLSASTTDASRSEMSLDKPVCFTDSKEASVFWIKGTNHKWKQFVENRVSTIGTLVPPQHWDHCPGAENPVNIPLRGMAALTLSETPLWLEGSHWLYSEEIWPEDHNHDSTESQLPGDCCSKM